MPLPRQVHIYNPFSIEQFRGADGRPTDHTFFYAGRMVQEKGVDTLIRAFATDVQRSSSETPPRLLLIGDGSGRPAIEKLVKELGLESSVTFAGKQSGTFPVPIELIVCCFGTGRAESGSASRT